MVTFFLLLDSSRALIRLRTLDAFNMVRPRLLPVLAGII